MFVAKDQKQISEEAEDVILTSILYLNLHEKHSVEQLLFTKHLTSWKQFERQTKTNLEMWHRLRRRRRQRRQQWRRRKQSWQSRITFWYYSVTRFGEISLLWVNFKFVSERIQDLFLNWKILGLGIWEIFLHLNKFSLLHFHWLNFEQIIWPSVANLINILWS